MGAYIAFGLNCEASVPKSDLKKDGWDEKQLLQFMAEKLDFPAENYMLVPSEDEFKFQLRTDLLERELIPMLEKVYPLFCPKTHHSKPWWESLTQELASMPPDSWIAWAESESCEYFDFRIEGYADEWFRLRSPSNEEIIVSFRHIRLMLEGKFMVEEYRQTFRFTQYCITHAFPEFALARSLRVYFVG